MLHCGRSGFSLQKQTIAHHDNKAFESWEQFGFRYLAKDYFDMLTDRKGWDQTTDWQISILTPDPEPLIAYL